MSDTDNKELWELVKSLRAENAALLELLLRNSDINGASTVEVKQAIGETVERIGREPWYLKQARLEKSCRKPKLSEIAGVPDVDDMGIVELTQTNG